MTSDDLKQHATSSHDFYALLGVSADSTEKDIKSAYRKVSIKYHPDKNPDNPEAIEKFHLLGIARDVLLDTEAKAAYDAAREARLQKQRRDELFQGARRRMKEDLERRESGAKRKRTEEADAEQKLEMEIRRLAEDGKRRRREREEAKRQDLKREEQDQKERDTAPTEPEKPSTPVGTPQPAKKKRMSWNLPGSVKGTPIGSKFAGGKPSFSFSPAGKASPSYEEATLARLKAAEKRRLEDQIRKQEAAQEAAEGS